MEATDMWDRFLGHVIALGALLGVIVDKLPAVAALLTVVWYGIRIWETRTVRGWVSRLSALLGGGE